MSNKKDLIKSIDKLIDRHGNTSPDLLRDLQAHRDELTNALNKKEVVNIVYRIYSIGKFIQDNWPD